MLRIVFSAALLSAASVSVSPAAFAQAAATPAYSTEATDIGTLIDTPETKAVLDKYLPGFSGNDQVAMARGMTLRQIQPMAGDSISVDALNKIDADLAKLPAKK